MSAREVNECCARAPHTAVALLQQDSRRLMGASSTERRVYWEGLSEKARGLLEELWREDDTPWGEDIAAWRGKP